MPSFIQRTRNTNDTASVPAAITLNDTTAVVIAVANLERQYFQVNVLPAVLDTCVFIRLYAAGDDNDAVGDWIGRFNFANDVFFKPSWRMTPDNIYTGEISAILIAGAADEDVYITEY